VKGSAQLLVLRKTGGTRFESRPHTAILTELLRDVPQSLQ
jgi:hypothetical protein